ncbi:MAG TPA: hypothetical protein DD381_10830 [Lentisphaeria bacterium]|nr:MAG: hypothetical protein A2X47_00770 [Lentisphaerae bacterium GWF2_38_69]HBM16821.1 hypothetical protein [Lentisphaeria bacterium]
MCSKFNKRIFVTGNAGSGKTTLAKHISTKLNIPFYSLDRIVWQPGWKTTPSVERKQLIIDLLNKDEWVIDGVSQDVLIKSNTVVFLDIPRHLCYIRLMRRNYRYLFKSRPELPVNCPEIKIIGKLISIVWNFKRNVRPTIMNHINDSSNKSIFHIKSTNELECLYKNILI